MAETDEDDNVSADVEEQVLISTTKAPHFYADLAVKMLADKAEVELAGLGYAIPAAVSVAEILKASERCVVTGIVTSVTTVILQSRKGERDMRKAKLTITVRRGAKYPA